MNELLDLLEQRTLAFVNDMNALRQENEKLRRDLTEQTGPLAEENAALKEALAQERAARDTAMAKIDALLERLTEHMPE